MLTLTLQVTRAPHPLGGARTDRQAMRVAGEGERRRYTDGGWHEVHLRHHQADQH